jgi:hypothetical protein
MNEEEQVFDLLGQQIELDNAVHERKLQQGRKPVHGKAHVPLAVANSKTAVGS